MSTFYQVSEMQKLVQKLVQTLARMDLPDEWNGHNADNIRTANEDAHALYNLIEQARGILKAGQPNRSTPNADA
jgi:hypothetical protein